MRIYDWSSDVCSSYLLRQHCQAPPGKGRNPAMVNAFSRLLSQKIKQAAMFSNSSILNWRTGIQVFAQHVTSFSVCLCGEHQTVQMFGRSDIVRSEEHTSELQSLMRISYAVFCLKIKTTKQ